MVQCYSPKTARDTYLNKTQRAFLRASVLNEQQRVIALAEAAFPGLSDEEQALARAVTNSGTKKA